MNLVILRPNELLPGDRARLEGERAAHLKLVLRVQVGDRIRIGVVDGPIGEATIRSTDDEAVELACELDGETPERSDDVLLLAIPRPRFLGRILEDATAVGFGRIVLLRTWRVDFSYLKSRMLSQERYQPHLLAGLAQGGRTRLPVIDVHLRFKVFVEDHMNDLLDGVTRYVAHPSLEPNVATLERPRDAFALAIGPERGFLPYEVDHFLDRGFQKLSLGCHPLRVEAACTALYGCLHTLRELERDTAPRKVER